MTFADQNVKITVRGRASVMSTLRMEDLTVTADFSRHYDAAAKQVELEVALPRMSLPVSSAGHTPCRSR